MASSYTKGKEKNEEKTKGRKRQRGKTWWKETFRRRFRHLCTKTLIGHENWLDADAGKHVGAVHDFFSPSVRELKDRKITQTKVKMKFTSKHFRALWALRAGKTLLLGGALLGLLFGFKSSARDALPEGTEAFREPRKRQVILSFECPKGSHSIASSGCVPFWGRTLFFLLPTRKELPIFLCRSLNTKLCVAISLSIQKVSLAICPKPKCWNLANQKGPSNPQSILVL